MITAKILIQVNNAIAVGVAWGSSLIKAQKIKANQ
jgi:hypothetical protein